MNNFLSLIKCEEGRARRMKEDPQLLARLPEMEHLGGEAGQSGQRAVWEHCFDHVQFEVQIEHLGRHCKGNLKM